MSEAAQNLPAETPEATTETVSAIGLKVVERLKTVFDPEIPVNIYDLGLIYKVDLNPVEEGKFDLHIDMTLTTPACPVAGAMPPMVERAVEVLDEVRNVKVDLVFTPPWDKSRMSDEAKLILGWS